MKFSDGFWNSKDGVIINSPTEAYRVVTDDKSMTVLAPCKHIAHRGDTLNGTVLTIKLSSPAPDVIRVQICHFKGGKESSPSFQINDTHPGVLITEDELEARLMSGNLSARINKQAGAWSMDFFDGRKRLTGSGLHHMGYITNKENQAYMREQLDLFVGECVYGLGERFTPFVKNGQVVDIWNEDGGTCSEQAYKNVPFYITNAGYGVFVCEPEKVSFEVASEVVSRVQFSIPGEELEYYVINGPSIKKVLERYTMLTGRPVIPPAWSFGLWLSTSFTTDYDEKTVKSFVEGMEQRKIPLGVFHFDCFWMKEFNWCDFEWDDRVFPDPEGMLSRLKQKGLHVCVWINPYIAQASALFNEGKENGYLLKRKSGGVWQWDRWQPGMGIVDFTNPEACKWFSSKLERLVDMGVDCFKTDFGERIPTEDVSYYDGSDPVGMHNYYTYLYNKTVFELLENKKGKGNALVFARSATVGSQQFPVHWGGDCSANYESMAETLRGGLSLGMCGFGFWSHDISGFENTATPDVYKRWVAFGLLSSHSRLHGSSSYRVPWAFDEEAVDVTRFFANLKCTLMPYIYKVAQEATLKGLPVLRAMVMEFQDDPACNYLDCQYMLGDSLLVAPVFTETGEVSYYLPHGQWFNLLTNEMVEGGSWRKEKHGYMSLPLMVRPGRILALGNKQDRTDYDYADDVNLLITHLDKGARSFAKVSDMQGETVLTADVVRDGDCLSITVNGKGSPWKATLAGVKEVKSVRGAALAVTDMGITITPENFIGTILISL